MSPVTKVPVRYWPPAFSFLPGRNDLADYGRRLEPVCPEMGVRTSNAGHQSEWQECWTTPFHIFLGHSGSGCHRWTDRVWAKLIQRTINTSQGSLCVRKSPTCGAGRVGFITTTGVVLGRQVLACLLAGAPKAILYSQWREWSPQWSILRKTLWLVFSLSKVARSCWWRCP